jgi:hypothetical protein
MPTQHFRPASKPRRSPLPPASAISSSSPGIPGFDENRALPDGFEAQFANTVHIA